MPCRSAPEQLREQVQRVAHRSLHVEFQKDQGRFQTNSFVAVNEGMVLDKMEQVGCGHMEDVMMQELSAKCYPWLGDGRLQQFAASQSFTAAIVPDLAGMQLKYILQSQKFRHVGLLRELLKGLLVTSIDFFARVPQFFFPSATFSRGNPDGGTIRGQLHRALRINLQKVENRPIDDNCPTVAMFDEIFEHLQDSSSVITMVIHCITKHGSCQKESTIVEEHSGPLSIAVGRCLCFRSF